MEKLMALEEFEQEYFEIDQKLISDIENVPLNGAKQEISITFLDEYNMYMKNGGPL